MAETSGPVPIGDRTTPTADRASSGHAADGYVFGDRALGNIASGAASCEQDQWIL